MKTKILITSVIIGIVIIVSFGYVINFGNEILDVVESDKTYRYPDCGLIIFSGDDDTCLYENQAANLDWSSVESCDKSGKII